MPKYAESQMTWLEAAEKVLKRAERPLTGAEIADRAMAQGLVVGKGKTPQKSLTAEIWKDQKWKRGPESPFIRVDDGPHRGKYWLRHKRIPAH